jgi:hypothetical protein
MAAISSSNGSEGVSLEAMFVSLSSGMKEVEN